MGTSGVLLSPPWLAGDAFSPSGAVLASTQWERGSASLRLHEVATGQRLAAVPDVYPHRWSDDGRFLLTRGKGLTGRARTEPRVGEAKASPQYNRFADGLSVYGDSSHLWELIHPVPSCRLGEPIIRLEFAPDNERLIINSSVWTAAGGLRPLPPESPGAVLTFTGDGEVWATYDASRDGRHRWPRQLAAAAVDLVGLAAGQSLQGVVPLAATLGAKRALLADGRPILRRLSGIPEVKALEIGHPDLEAEQERERLIWWVRRDALTPALALRPDGAEVAMSYRDGLALFDTATGKQHRRLSTWEFDRLAWSRDGKHLLAVTGGSLPDRPHLFDASTGKEVARRPADKGGWVCFDFSPDGRWIVRGRENRFVYLEDRDTGKLLARWQAHDDAVTALAFSPDGKALLTGGRDGSVRVWPIPYLRQELAKMGLDWE
jgi:dipeptidyl aminopeptidase/acylaminoacyl peptidase